MPGTSLKLSDELKLRAAKVAEDLGISPHAFMIGAIQQATEAAEQRARFVAEAQAARTEMQETGLGYDAEDVRQYLRQRLDDKQIDRPNAKPWRE